MRLVEIICLRDEIVEYVRRVFERVATVAVDGHVCAVIEQFQPKQWRAIDIDSRTSQHTDLVTAYRDKRNRYLLTVLGKGAKTDVSSCDFQFGYVVRQTKQSSKANAGARISKAGQKYL
jgi:hypothetical protein